MLEHLKGTLSERKARLLLAGVARLGWDDLKDDGCREAVIAAEEYADGLLTDEQLRAAGHKAAMARSDSWTSRILYARELAHVATDPDPILAATLLGDWAVTINEPDRVELLKLIRELVGNPFRPVSMDSDWFAANEKAASHIAWGIYEERAFDQLSILADALMDAGCEDRQLLGHLRSRAPHVLGCWALDLLLSKS
jgi:hypothetical protein